MHASSAIGLSTVAQASLRLHAQRQSHRNRYTLTHTDTWVYTREDCANIRSPNSTVRCCNNCAPHIHTQTLAYSTRKQKSRMPNAEARSYDDAQNVESSKRGIRSYRQYTVAEQRANDTNDRDRTCAERNEFCYSLFSLCVCVWVPKTGLININDKTERCS